MFSSGVEPLAAFGGIQDVAGRLPSTFWTALRERAELWHDSFSEQLDYDKALRKVFSHLAAKKSSLLPRDLNESLESFPTEVGPGGRTLWGFALANYSDETVEVNFTQLAVTAGWNPKLFSDETGHGSGWAMGEFNLTSDATILAKCSSSFYLDSDLALRLADVYGENRSVHVLHLQKGQHRVFVKAAEPGFRCEFLLDGAKAREALTGMAARGPEKALSPLVLLKDVAVSEVIGSDLASPHLGIPILNTAREPLHLLSAAIVEEAVNLSVQGVHPGDLPAVQPGQAMILRLNLQQVGQLTCHGQPKVFTFTVALQPEGNHAPVHASITTQCRRSADRGFLVAYPDFDGSIQKLWAAPPDVSQFANRTCPPRGCPVMLSLHGASVSVGPVWGHSYELGGEERFPYGAWLVQPTNRWHWGTDWEGPGLDNALGALRYVRDELPGAPGNATERRKSHGLDDTRVLVTGHSMGGHGCFVFASHFPDLLLGAACASGWPSLNSYAGDSHSGLLDGTRRGLLEEARFEHAADFAHENLVGVPMLVIYGSKDDNVPPTQPRNMVRLLESAGQKDSTVTAVELPGVGHWFGQDEPSLAKWFQERLNASFAGGDLRLPQLPEYFEFSVTSPATYGSRGSLQVLQQLDAAEPGRIFVQRCPKTKQNITACTGIVAPEGSGGGNGDPYWRVATFNVRRLALRPRRGQALPRMLSVDGTTFASSGLLSKCAHLCRAEKHSTWKVCGLGSDGCDWEAVQRGGLQAGAGPVHAALRRAPLCLAFGAGQRSQAVTLANKLYFVSRYAPRVVDASGANFVGDRWDLPGECASANLLLIGSPSENAWTSRFSCAFPYLQFVRPESNDAGRSFILDGTSYSANGTGLLAVGPLPSRKLALLVHGTDEKGLAQAVAAVPVTSGRHGADFLVLGPSAAWKGEGGILAAGYLTPLWQISSSGWAEPEHPFEGGGGLGSTPAAHCSVEMEAITKSDVDLE
ncbi:unnamed protein product, partial [Symbiodinium sp. CCMP2456]